MVACCPCLQWHGMDSCSRGLAAGPLRVLPLQPVRLRQGRHRPPLHRRLWILHALRHHRRLARRQTVRPPACLPPAISFPYSSPNPMWLAFSLTNRLWCASSRGRKRACITYCISYILSCITKHSPEYRVLMIGRILGGIATSLLFSAFESWLVAEHNKVTHRHCLASCPPDLPITVCLSPSLNYRCCLHH